MRFMMLVLPEGYGDAAPGTVPDDAERVAKMMEYNKALQEAGVIAEMDKNEAHLIFTAEFGDIGSKQNFSSHLKDFNDLRRLPQGANDDERVKIDRFMNIINRFI